MIQTRRSVSWSLTVALLLGCLCAPAWAQPLRDGAILQVIETPETTLFKIHRIDNRATKNLGETPSFQGDTYSFEPQLGAFIDSIFQCLSPHTSDTDDNNVLFDGLSELLDPYLNGTQPLVFEFETPDPKAPDTNEVNFEALSDGDLFPEGFEDPSTGTPLNAGCVEIGLDDLLDPNVPVEVTNATLSYTANNGNTTVLPPTDITPFLGGPFEGRVSIGFTNMTGRDIDGIQLQMTIQQPDPTAIFSDGFESGDASAWN